MISPPTSFLCCFFAEKKGQNSKFILTLSQGFFFLFPFISYSIILDFIFLIYNMKSISVGNARLKFFSNLCSNVNRWAKFQVYWPNTFSPYINIWSSYSSKCVWRLPPVYARRQLTLPEFPFQHICMSIKISQAKERDKISDSDLFLWFLLMMYMNIYIFIDVYIHIYIYTCSGRVFLIARTNSNGKDRKSTH